MTIGSISNNRQTGDYVYASTGRLREIENDNVIERKQRLESQFQAVEKARAVDVESVRLEDLIQLTRLRENSLDQGILLEDQLSRLGFSESISYDSYYSNYQYRALQQNLAYHYPYLSILA